MRREYTDAGEQRAPRRTKRKKRRTGRRLLLLLIALALIIGYRVTDGFSGLSLPGRSAPTENIHTEFALDLNALAAQMTGEGDYIPEAGKIEALQEIAHRNPEYAEKIEFFIDRIGHYDSTAVNSIILSPEKTDFVLLAPFAEGTPSGNHDISLTAGEVPFLIQYDSRWAFHNFGSSVVGNTGCGPTCLSMALIALTGNTAYTPDYVCDFAQADGYYIPEAGTAWSLFTGAPGHFGLTGREIPLDKGEMRDALSRGEVIIASMLPGDFTMAGHFIVIHDSTLTGFEIYDPSSVERSGKIWSFERLAEQIAGIWAIGE